MHAWLNIRYFRGSPPAAAHTKKNIIATRNNRAVATANITHTDTGTKINYDNYVSRDAMAAAAAAHVSTLAKHSRVCV